MIMYDPPYLVAEAEADDGENKHPLFHIPHEKEVKPLFGYPKDWEEPKKPEEPPTKKPKLNRNVLLLLFGGAALIMVIFK